MPFDSLVLSAVTRELCTTIVGAQLQKVTQPHELEIHLNLRSPGKTHRLLISADARFGRVCLTDTTPTNPPTAPRFCMALRKHLEGSHLAKITQIDFDRIIFLDFQYGDGTTKRLIIEIMGQHSNVILVDSGEVILEAMKRIPKRLSRVREVLPGRHYAPPPGGEKANPIDVDPSALVPAENDELVPWLQQKFSGMGGWLVREIAARSEESNLVEAWAQIFSSAREGRYEPTLLTDAGRLVDYFAMRSVQFPASRQRKAASMNSAVDLVAENLSQHTGLEEARQSLARSITSALKAAEARAQEARKGLTEADRAEEYRMMGELLVSNLGQIKKGQREAVVTNYYDPDAGPIAIPLDPKLSPKENADVYFRRQRKVRESREELEKKITRLAEMIYDLKVAKLELGDKTEVTQIEALRGKLVLEGLLSRPQAPIKRAARETAIPRVKKVTTPEGWEILVGESAEANDYVTMKMASSSDLWFHARAVAGAHVILRAGGRPVGHIPPAVIREAARLAALSSDARHSAIVPVDYTQKRYVRKPRGSAAGNVLYTHEKTLHVELK